MVFKPRERGERRMFCLLLLHDSDFVTEYDTALYFVQCTLYSSAGAICTLETAPSQFNGSMQDLRSFGTLNNKTCRKAYAQRFQTPTPPRRGERFSPLLSRTSTSSTIMVIIRIRRLTRRSFWALNPFLFLLLISNILYPE